MAAPETESVLVPAPAQPTRGAGVRSRARLERMADGQLVTLTLNGEGRAFPVLMARYEPKLHSLAARRVRNTEDAADIVQDTLISAWAALQSWPAVSPFETWLICIALNKCRDWGRRRTVRLKAAGFLADLQPLAEPDAERELIRGQALGELADAMGGLPASLREPLGLTALDEVSHRDAAQRLGISVKAVETRVRRARIALRERLGG